MSSSDAGEPVLVYDPKLASNKSETQIRIKHPVLYLIVETVHILLERGTVFESGWGVAVAVAVCKVGDLPPSSPPLPAAAAIRWTQALLILQ